MSRPIRIDAESIDQYTHRLLELNRLQPTAADRPGPFPSSALMEHAGMHGDSSPHAGELFEDLRKAQKERLKNLDAILRGFPREYADRLLFAHTIQLVVARELFPNVKHLADDLMYFESILHLEPQEEYYRDHFVHPLEVGCIAEQLLEQVTVDGTPLLHVLSDSFKRLVREERTGLLSFYLKACSVSENDLDEKWVRTALWVAALYHDLGYFAQKAGKFFGDRLMRTFPMGGMDLSEGFRRGRYELKDELIWWQAEQWRRDVAAFQCFETEYLLDLMARLDHPAYGAWAVSILSRAMLRFTLLSPAEFCAFEVAAHAILLHDHTGLAKHIGKSRQGRDKGEAGAGSEGAKAPEDRPLFHLNYWDNPLAVLLVLADHLSEFNRERLVPSREPGNSRSTTLSVERMFEGVTVALRDNSPDDTANITLEIEFELADGKEASDHFREDKQWFLPCDPPRPGVKPFLDFTDAPFQVLVRLPKSRPGKPR